MKITGSTDLPRPGASATGRTQEAHPGKSAAEGGSSVSLSELASRLQTLEADLAAGQPFDAARVDEIKQAIREGRFKVNAEVVADRLIESMKELLARKP